MCLMCTQQGTPKPVQKDIRQKVSKISCSLSHAAPVATDRKLKFGV